MESGYKTRPANHQKRSVVVGCSDLELPRLTRSNRFVERSETCFLFNEFGDIIYLAFLSFTPT